MQIAGPLCYTAGMRLKAACLLLALCVFVPTAPALSLTDIDANASILAIGTYPPAAYGGPNPALTYLLGVSLPLWLTNIFFLEPDLELFGTLYEWTGDYGTAVPAIEDAEASFFTLGALVSAQAGVSFPVSSVVSLGGSLGLDFLLRFPLDPFYTDTLSVSGRQPALGYFFAEGRFFYPESRLFMRWAMTPTLTLIANLRVFYPLFHAWDGLGQPFLDQFMASAGVGVAIRLRPAALNKVFRLHLGPDVLLPRDRAGRRMPLTARR